MTGQHSGVAAPGADDRRGAFPNCLPDLLTDREARIVDASWAVAARDCALEARDRQAAARFAVQARAAIAAAAAGGISRRELAAELDYPGGHTAMDGPYIDHEIAALPPKAAPNPLIRYDRTSDPTAAAAGLPAAVAALVEDEAAEASRTEQLNRWHQDDHSTAEGDQSRTADDGWS